MTTPAGPPEQNSTPTGQVGQPGGGPVRGYEPATVLAAVLAVLVVGVAVVMAVVLGQNDKKAPSSASAAPASTGSVGAVTGPPVAEGVVVGKSSKVTIDVYEDYMCPYCGQFEKTSGTELDELATGDSATVRYHIISILDRASSTNYSTRAASAAYCANDAGVFSKYHALLMANQPGENTSGLPDEALVVLGKQAGAGSDEFAQCVNGHRYATYVGQVTEHASSVGVAGTPTVLVNGKQLTSPSVESLRQAVQAASGS